MAAIVGVSMPAVRPCRISARNTRVPCGISARISADAHSMPRPIAARARFHRSVGDSCGADAAEHTLLAIAASISTTATGVIFEGLGQGAGFLILAAVSAVATALLWAAMPETIPAKYL